MMKLNDETPPEKKSISESSFFKLIYKNQEKNFWLFECFVFIVCQSLEVLILYTDKIFSLMIYAPKKYPAR